MAAATATTAIEWESTISIPISGTEFQQIKLSPILHVDVLFQMENGTRLSNRNIQQKVMHSEKRLLGFHNGHCFPITRTIASEDSAAISLHIIRSTYRLITFQNENLRVSYNKHETENGSQHSVEYEIEYPENSDYETIIHYEKQLMQRVINDKRGTKRNTINLENMFACIMSKVQMWHCFNEDRPYKWAYKWNGVKAKVLITNSLNNDKTGHIVYIWPDASYIRTAKLVCSTAIVIPEEIMDFITNACLLVEILDDRIVIIEVIGVNYYDEIFTTEPETNVRMLNYLSEHLTRSTMQIDNKPLQIQQYFDAPKPLAYDFNRFDGFIIVQDDLVIKWKIPTIDVKCIRPYTYEVGDEILKIDSHIGEINKIYELSNNLKIIRARTDRLASSSRREYLIFKKSCELLN